MLGAAYLGEVYLGEAFAGGTVSASFTVTGPNGATTLPSNHNGNIVLTIVGTNTKFSTDSVVFTVVAGSPAVWAKVSQTITDDTHATITVSCPAVASPPSGATGTLSISDNDTANGAATGTIAVNTPTLSVSPNSGNVGNNTSTSFTGNNTLWITDNPQFTESGGTSASIGTATETSNTASTAIVTYGTAAATLTITDPSTGAATTITVNSVTPGAVADVNVFFSPYNWYSDGGGALQSNNVKGASTYVQTSSAGAYVKIDFTGTGITLNYDNTIYGGVANNYSQISWTVDDGGIQSYQLVSTDSGAKALATGLTQGAHKLVCWLKNINANGAGSAGAWDWTTTTTGIKITSFTLAGSPTSTSAPTLRPKRAIFFGDSISAGAHAAQGDINTMDAVSSYCARVAEALNAEYGTIAYGGTGWLQAAGGVPTFHTVGTATSQSWQWYALSKSRLVSSAFSPAPDYVNVTHGTNDGIASATNASITAAANDWVTQMQTAAPTAKVFVTNPFGRFMKTALSAVTLNTNQYYIDLDANSPSDQLLAQGLGNLPTGDAGGAFGAANGQSSGTASRRAGDGLHPNSITQAEIGARLAQAITSKLQQSGSGGRFRIQ